MQGGKCVMAASRAEKGKQRSELGTRTMSSIVIAAVVLFGINYGGILWAVIASLIALKSLDEYYRLISRKGSRVSPGMGYIFSLIFLIAAMKESAQPIILAMILSLCVFFVMTIEIFRRQKTKGTSNVIFNTGGIVSGILYITVPWVCMIMLGNYAFGRQILMTIFFCTWACDVGAYLGGKKFGNIKLCEHVSPGKTVQGFIFGIIGSLIANAASIYFFSFPEYLMFIGFVCGIAGQVGDLAESLIKREAGQKDSGTLIPGHGGMLDRFDSILFNGLLTYLILRVLLTK